MVDGRTSPGQVVVGTDTKHHKVTAFSTLPGDMQGANTTADLVTMLHAKQVWPSKQVVQGQSL